MEGGERGRLFCCSCRSDADSGSKGSGDVGGGEAKGGSFFPLKLP